MSKCCSRFRNAVLVVLILMLAGLVVLHLNFPLPYVYRVCMYRDADFEDIHRFPASAIAASESPSELPVVADPNVPGLIEQHPDIENFDSFLDETETTAFIIVHNGQIVLERYLLGHTDESMQNTFSVSKSVASALVGLAVRDELISLDDPITKHLPELGKRDREFSKITIEHLLDMQSGIRFSSEVAFPIINADNPLIYYHPDLESVALERTDIVTEPGAFRYNNYNPPLLGLILRRTTAVTVSEYLERELWQPLGANAPAGWTTDDRGVERMESGFHAQARDLARFGLLYLNRGFVEDQSVIPESWVLESTAQNDVWEVEAFDGRTWGYHGGWWVVPRPESPSDFCAIGRFGQFIYVSPRHNAVFIRTGPGRGEWGDRDWTELFYSLAERL